MPTTALTAGHTLFRAVPEKYMPKPATGRSVSKGMAEGAFRPRDGAAGSEKSDKNRFTGLFIMPVFRRPEACTACFNSKLL